MALTDEQLRDTDEFRNIYMRILQKLTGLVTMMFAVAHCNKLEIIFYCVILMNFVMFMPALQKLTGPVMMMFAVVH